MRAILLSLMSVLVVGCAGKLDYTRPSSYSNASSNSITIDKSRDAVWSSSVPALGKKFFVINNLDKASGLINISYTGDPERYVDCGQISSYVKNLQGERTYNFPGALAQKSYELMTPGGGLFFVDRKMSLEGRANLIFEEIGPTKTRVTANTRYVLNRQQTIRSAANNFPQNFSNSISFNSGSGASFPPGRDGRAVECVSTGVLEREILSAIR